MIKIYFFAQIRELIGIEKLEIDYTASLTIEQLREQLSQRSARWALALAKENVLYAQNHVIATGDSVISQGDEIAFFPPVTGG